MDDILIKNTKSIHTIWQLQPKDQWSNHSF